MSKKPCGTRRVKQPHELYWIPENGPKQLVPLRSVDYDVLVAGATVRVSLTQHFYNEFDLPINVFYNFPTNENSVFGGLTAEFKGRKVEGKIKKKDEAKKEFNKHKAKGDVVAYADTSKSAPDIMNLELGNLPAKEDLKITFVYYEKVAVCYNNLFRITIPSTLTPRYTSRNIIKKLEDEVQSDDDSDDWYSALYEKKQKKVELPPEVYYSSGKPYTWNIKVQINKVDKLTHIFTPTHKNDCIVQNHETSGQISFHQDKYHYPNRDFEMFYAYESMFAPTVHIGQMSDSDAQIQEEPKKEMVL